MLLHAGRRLVGKVLVFMDACHSGKLVGHKKRRVVVVTSAVVNELAMRK